MTLQEVLLDCLQSKVPHAYSRHTHEPAKENLLGALVNPRLYQGALQQDINPYKLSSFGCKLSIQI